MPTCGLCPKCGLTVRFSTFIRDGKKLFLRIYHVKGECFFRYRIVADPPSKKP